MLYRIILRRDNIPGFLCNGTVRSDTEHPSPWNERSCPSTGHEEIHFQYPRSSGFSPPGLSEAGQWRGHGLTAEGSGLLNTLTQATCGTSTLTYTSTTLSSIRSEIYTAFRLKPNFLIENFNSHSAKGNKVDQRHRHRRKR